MSQVFAQQQQQGNRTERRRLQREESKKWRKDEKKLMRNGPNGSKYNPKKSRRATPSGTTESMNDAKPNKRKGPPVSIKNRDFIIIDKVFDSYPVCEPFSPIEFLNSEANEAPIVPDIFENSTPKELNVPEVELEEKEDKLQTSMTTLSNEEIEKVNVENDTFTDQIHNSDTKNVTVSEVPALNENIDDEINETRTVKSDTLKEEDLQNASVQEHNDSHVTVDTIPIVERKEEQLETPSTLEDRDMVPTPSIGDKSIPVNTDESTLLNTDKNSQWNTSATKMFIADENSPSTTTSSSTTRSSTIATKNQSRKRSIISRIFKNNRIEIKQKPQEKKITTIKEQPEKKKVSPWKKIWKKL